MTLTARQLVDQLGLLPHPEGGFFRETYRDALRLSDLPARFAGPRNACTAIYYLLGRGDMSALHRIASDEVWHHYAGGPLTVHVLHQEQPGGARHEALRLGMDLAAGERPQAVVPAGAWFGAQRPERTSACALPHPQARRRSRGHRSVRGARGGGDAWTELIFRYNTTICEPPVHKVKTFTLCATRPTWRTCSHELGILRAVPRTRRAA